MAGDPIREYLSEIGRKGGKVTGVPKGFGAATPEQRKANAKKAAKTRWGKKAATKPPAKKAAK